MTTKDKTNPTIPLAIKPLSSEEEADLLRQVLEEGNNNLFMIKRGFYYYTVNTAEHGKLYAATGLIAAVLHLPLYVVSIDNGNIRCLRGDIDQVTRMIHKVERVLNLSKDTLTWHWF